MSLFSLRAHPVGVYLLLECEYLNFEIEHAIKTVAHHMWLLGHSPQEGGRNLTSTYFFIVTMGFGLFEVRLNIHTDDAGSLSKHARRATR